MHDKRIKRFFQRPGTDHSFRADLAGALRADNGALCEQLICLRRKAGIGEDIGVLRVFDVIAWMHQGGEGRQPSGAGLGGADR